MTAEPFAAGGEPPPSGMILPFKGNAGSIPEGWFLCDGNNGTPDLRGKHLKNVPDGVTDPGATGGQDSVSLSENQMPAHAHGGSTGSKGSHQHPYGRGVTEDTGSGRRTGGSLTTASAGSHAHAINDDNAGSGNSIDNRPEYIELNYIQRA